MARRIALLPEVIRFDTVQLPGPGAPQGGQAKRCHPRSTLSTERSPGAEPENRLEDYPKAIPGVNPERPPIA